MPKGPQRQKLPADAINRADMVGKHRTTDLPSLNSQKAAVNWGRLLEVTLFLGLVWLAHQVAVTLVH